MKPKTRRIGLLIRELPDELLVYDQEQHRAHCLNRTAALVFQQADGSRTLDDLARMLDPDAGPQAVSAAAQALAQLADAGLLESEPRLSTSAAGLTRRDVARRIGLAAAILLPAMVTIVAPTPAEAAATCVNDCNGKVPGTPCSSFGPPCTETCSVGCGATCPTGACSDLGGA